MAGAPIRQNVTGDPAQDQRGRELTADLAPFLNCPFLKGVAVKGVTLPLNDTKRITHKLGRVPQGCLVTKSTGYVAQFYWQSADDKYLTVYSIHAATADLWVY